ncbi:MAG: MarR family transcriptional regulator [Solirubrobacteraceae bacterium]|nr:MarR family transcriptional regulator [Solirubrobacteraceae bacterium]
MPDTADRLAGRFTDVIGRDHVRTWTPAEIGAWTGLIETFESQQRGYATDLERTFGLSPSAAGLLGRVAGSEEGRMRLSTLADSAGLSLSRVSRIVDGLERRGLVEKKQCSGDGRATNAHVTDAGRAAAASAQDFLNAWLRQRFFAQLTTDEIESLATVFGRLTRNEERRPAPVMPAVVPCGD